MQTNIVRFTNYGTSRKNCELTCSTGIVGISQSAASTNDVVYMCYLYEDRFYVFGRALVSLVIPTCKWPDKNEFVAYCQSEQKIEFCSPIDVEELSLQSICEISWHLEKGQPVVDELAANRICAVFDKNRLEAGERPLLNGESHDFKPDYNQNKIGSPRVSLWSRFLSWLYEDNSQQQAFSPNNSKTSH